MPQRSGVRRSTRRSLSPMRVNNRWVVDEAVKGETRPGRHDKGKNQNRDKSPIHVVSSPAAGSGL